jgi:hypothetical protein
MRSRHLTQQTTPKNKTTTNLADPSGLPFFIAHFLITGKLIEESLKKKSPT